MVDSLFALMAELLGRIPRMLKKQECLLHLSISAAVSGGSKPVERALVASCAACALKKLYMEGMLR